MRFNKLLMVILGCLTLFALPASAETPILEELMRKYTFPLIFLSLLGGVLTVGYLYVTGLLPKVIFESWKWIDERFALHNCAAIPLPMVPEQMTTTFFIFIGPDTI